ncbi:UNVERIFIED_CONTAM: hypothetical protein DQE83_26525 [Escherichia coli]
MIITLTQLNLIKTKEIKWDNLHLNVKLRQHKSRIEIQHKDKIKILLLRYITLQFVPFVAALNPAAFFIPS